MEYGDQMKLITDKAIYDLTIVKQSEFKKPYAEDDYPTMEYAWPYPPPWPPPPYDPPWPPGPPVDPPIIITKVFTCGYSLCYCPGKKRCGSLNCTYPVESVSVTAFDAGDGSITGGHGSFCISATAEASGEIEFRVIMVATDRGAGNQLIKTKGIYEGHISECPEDECGGDCGGESIGYTSQGMSCGAEQTFTVIGGHDGSVYTWEVSGGGSITSGGVYTAPATNANCSSNAVIHLLCNGTTVATLAIAINCYADPGTAYIADGAGCTEFICTLTNPVGCPLPNTFHAANCAFRTRYNYNCSGVQGTANGQCSGGSVAVCQALNPDWCEDFAAPWCDALGSPSGRSSCATLGSCAVEDKRSAAMLAAGCCPVQLL